MLSFRFLTAYMTDKCSERFFNFISVWELLYFIFFFTTNSTTHSFKSLKWEVKLPNYHLHYYFCVIYLVYEPLHFTHHHLLLLLSRPQQTNEWINFLCIFEKIEKIISENENETSKKKRKFQFSSFFSENR